MLGTPLWDEVVTRLNNKHSPQQIAHRLRQDFPEDPTMWVSHETIYQALYVQAAGGLRHELTVEKALRSGRTTRGPRSRLSGRGSRSWIGEATITNRPAEVEDRAVPGHWEGDLIIGKSHRSGCDREDTLACDFVGAHRSRISLFGASRHGEDEHSKDLCQSGQL